MIRPLNFAFPSESGSTRVISGLGMSFLRWLLSPIQCRCALRPEQPRWGGGATREFRMSQAARKVVHPMALVALVACVGCVSFGPDLPGSSEDEIALRGASPGVRTLAADGQIEVLTSPELARRLQTELRERPLSIIAFSDGGAG